MIIFGGDKNWSIIFHWGRYFGQFFPVGRGSHRVCEKGCHKVIKHTGWYRYLLVLIFHAALNFYLDPFTVEPGKGGGYWGWKKLCMCGLIRNLRDLQNPKNFLPLERLFYNFSYRNLKIFPKLVNFSTLRETTLKFSDFCNP